LIGVHALTGGTDSKHYARLTDKIFRFEPIAVSRQRKDLARVHGTDERIEETALILQIKFFLHFIKITSAAID
jgi:carboxypeptidase PM20D1